MIKAPTLSVHLRRLGWGRLWLVGLLLLIGAALRLWAAFPFHFPLFTLCLIGAALASVVFLLALPKTTNLPRFAWLQLILDLVLATAIVAVSGGPQSLFVFLYILSIIAASVLLSRPGGMVIAGLASLLYTGLILGRIILPQTIGLKFTESSALDVLTMFTNTGVFLVVAILTGSLKDQAFKDSRS